MHHKDLLQLSQEYQSPLYVYDADKIESQYVRLTSAFSKVNSLRINYAVKALSNVTILRLMKKTSPSNLALIGRLMRVYCAHTIGA